MYSAKVVRDVGSDVRAQTVPYEVEVLDVGARLLNQPSEETGEENLLSR